MTFLPFNEVLPVDYFGDGQKLTNRGKGRVEKRRDSLVDLLNDLREKTIFGGYQVDPDDENKFSTINAAVAAADLELASGEPISIVLSPGKTHTLDGGSLTPPDNRHLYIEPVSESRDVERNDNGTIISGDISLPDSELESVRRQFKINNCILNGNVDGNKNWHMHLHDMHLNGHVTRTHGAKGCLATFDKITTESGVFYLDDLDASPSQADGRVQINDCNLNLKLNGGVVFNFSGPVTMELCNTYLFLFLAAPSSLIDMNNSDVHVSIVRSYFDFATMNVLTLFANPDASTEINILQGNIIRHSVAAGNDPIIFTLSAGIYLGSPTFYSTLEPTDAPVGTIWNDTELNDSLVWDGTYWGNGGIFRKDLLVDVGSAGVSHTSGWTVPTGAGVINTSANALKDLTSGGGATLYGISDGSDGDKFAESSAIVTNSKASAKQASINVGGGDTIYVHSMTVTGTEGGTLAGSNDEDVRVVVYFTMPKTLPSV